MWVEKTVLELWAAGRKNQKLKKMLGCFKVPLG